MAGTVQDVLCIPGLLENPTGGSVDFPPAQITTAPGCRFDQLHRGITR